MCAYSRLLTGIAAVHCFWWYGYVFRMPACRIPFRSLFVHAGQGWKRRCGGQTMTDQVWRTWLRPWPRSVLPAFVFGAQGMKTVFGLKHLEIWLRTGVKGTNIICGLSVELLSLKNHKPSTVNTWKGICFGMVHYFCSHFLLSAKFHFHWYRPCFQASEYHMYRNTIRNQLGKKNRIRIS